MSHLIHSFLGHSRTFSCYKRYSINKLLFSTFSGQNSSAISLWKSFLSKQKWAANSRTFATIRIKSATISPSVASLTRELPLVKGSTQIDTPAPTQSVHGSFWFSPQEIRRKNIFKNFSENMKTKNS